MWQVMAYNERMSQRQSAGTPLQARKQDFVRNAIWDAAIELFAARGFEETTIDEIARAAGVSTRTFFRYFASKADLMGQGMVTYRTLLGDAIRQAPSALSPVEALRHAVHKVAADAAAQPRTRQIVDIASASPAAREAQLARRAEVENALAEAFAVRTRAAANDAMSSRLLAALTLAVVDVTFRVWSKTEEADIVAIADDVLGTLRGLAADLPALPRTRRRPRRGLPKPE
jgi:AcrR family transcriptional regulator